MKFIAGITLLVVALVLVTGHTVSSAAKSNSIIPGDSKSRKIALVGDLQRTSIWELVMGREQNDPERGLIVKSISTDNPAMVILLGDMVFDGSNSFQWDYFDSLMNPVTEKNIPVKPVIGNHEYWGKRSSNLSFLYKRFPFFRQKTWYAQTHDSLALIFLNSNHLELSPYEWEEQINWYNNRIYNFQNDPAIKGILVFTHHPPYTNSLITGDEEEVQEAFLSAFNKSTKTLAFISGHAHTYERFIINKKTFIVSGGGGGPRVPLKIGLDSHDDLCKEKSPRPFNYLLAERVNDGVNITVKALKKDSKKFYILENFTIPFNQNYNTASNVNLK